MPITPEQFNIVSQQLGRQPRGIVDIVASSASGIPLVLQMRSLVDDQPFPTLYWLCSRELSKAIGQIEGRGWVKKIENELQEDTTLREQYWQDHQAYVLQRWQAMHPEDKLRIEQKGMSELFDRYGIGGITQWDKVRCLHMQYAHHLASANHIGALLDDLFNINELVKKL